MFLHHDPISRDGTKKEKEEKKLMWQGKVTEMGVGDKGKTKEDT